MKWGSPSSGRVARLSLLLVLAALAGCAKTDEELCASSGLTPATDAFGKCVAQRQQVRTQAMQQQLQAHQSLPQGPPP